ncbi:MAG: mechanosensitive ion channel [Bdellovibrionales bacterium]|nr:mechanosensitive ion channel [Bdellovibrionales bacterium]
MESLSSIDWVDVFEIVKSLWHFKVVTVNEKSFLTLGQLITGIVLLVLGYFICRRLSRIITKKFISKLDIEDALKVTIETAVFYVLLVILTLFVLRLLKVPTEIFTVIGGALAIGVGFGTQNIVNNFFSGLILMIERPIRVGDFVEVDGIFGSIEAIGARSTRIKSMDNTHVVVPNASFLEKNVLNWTLSDSLVRSSVKVGVAYGSDTKKVRDLLLEAVNEQEFVLKFPKASLLFSDFADSSLNFEVFFWTKLKDVLQIKQIQSQIRFRIDDLFRQNNVVISFPQRDVHLDTLKPLQIEMIK